MPQLAPENLKERLEKLKRRGEPVQETQEITPESIYEQDTAVNDELGYVAMKPVAVCLEQNENADTDTEDIINDLDPIDDSRLEVPVLLFQESGSSVPEIQLKQDAAIGAIPAPRAEETFSDPPRRLTGKGKLIVGFAALIVLAGFYAVGSQGTEDGGVGGQSVVLAPPTPAPPLLAPVQARVSSVALPVAAPLLAQNEVKKELLAEQKPIPVSDKKVKKRSASKPVKLGGAVLPLKFKESEKTRLASMETKSRQSENQGLPQINAGGGDLIEMLEKIKNRN